MKKINRNPEIDWTALTFILLVSTLLFGWAIFDPKQPNQIDQTLNGLTKAARPQVDRNSFQFR